MHSSSETRTKIYQDIVEDVLVSGLLEDDEIMELRDLLKRVERKMRGDIGVEREAR
jgi:coenzyme F420-reducing hydrogenase beta subunit